MDCYLGFVMYFGGNFAPRNFSTCQGQTIAISQSSALFSVLGTSFGGNGTTTFMLPHLGGRVPVGTGQAPGLSHNYQVGEVAGVEQLTLNTGQMPMHVHAFSSPFALQALSGVAAGDESDTPTAGAFLGTVADTSGGTASPVLYAPAGSGTPVNLAGGTITGTTGVAGGSSPVPIMQPYLGLTAVICTQGIFPSRN